MEQIQAVSEYDHLKYANRIVLVATLGFDSVTNISDTEMLQMMGDDRKGSVSRFDFEIHDKPLGKSSTWLFKNPKYVYSKKNSGWSQTQSQRNGNWNSRTTTTTEHESITRRTSEGRREWRRPHAIMFKLAADRNHHIQKESQKTFGEIKRVKKNSLVGWLYYYYYFQKNRGKPWFSQ